VLRDGALVEAERLGGLAIRQLVLEDELQDLAPTDGHRLDLALSDCRDDRIALGVLPLADRLVVRTHRQQLQLELGVVEPHEPVGGPQVGPDAVAEDAEGVAVIALARRERGPPLPEIRHDLRHRVVRVVAGEVLLGVTDEASVDLRVQRDVGLAFLVRAGVELAGRLAVAHGQL
jgi:hypothetical protein